jgi:hypothetical protein
MFVPTCNKAKKSRALTERVAALEMEWGIAVPKLGTIWSASTGALIKADTTFGTGVIGSITVQITMNYLFGKIKELESKVHILQEHAKNTSIVFHRIPFLS